MCVSLLLVHSSWRRTVVVFCDFKIKTNDKSSHPKNDSEQNSLDTVKCNIDLFFKKLSVTDAWNPYWYLLPTQYRPGKIKKWDHKITTNIRFPHLYLQRCDLKAFENSFCFIKKSSHHTFEMFWHRDYEEKVVINYKKMFPWTPRLQ